MEYAASFALTFVSVFLKGLQYKNVIGGHLRMVAVTAYAMAFMDVVSVALVVHGGWTLALSAGAGASLGMITSIKLHDSIFKRKPPT